MADHTFGALAGVTPVHIRQFLTVTRAKSVEFRYKARRLADRESLHALLGVVTWLIVSDAAVVIRTAREGFRTVVQLVRHLHF